MQLLTVPAHFIDRAWADGAACLAEACDVSGGEITGDQLKMILSRGERTLLQMKDGDKINGWAVVKVDQLPNLRVLHVTSLVAHNGQFEEFFIHLKRMASDSGCSRVRCSAKPAQARLYQMKCGFVPLYQTLEVAL